MKLFNLILGIILIGFVCFSCTKDNPLGEFYVPDELKSFNPFHGYETLRFQSDRNIIELKADDRFNEITKSYGYYPHDYYLCEADYIVFSNSDYSLQINMQACYSYPVAEGIEFRFNYLDSNYIFSSYYKLLPIENTTKHYDSLLISGSWIHEIYYDTMRFIRYDKPFPYDKNYYPIKSYYSKAFGVVKLDFSNDTTWELQEIIW